MATPENVTGFCAISLAGCLDGRQGQDKRPQGEALPVGKDTLWQISTVLYTSGGLEQTTFGVILHSLPEFITKEELDKWILNGSTSVFSENPHMKFGFKLAKTTLRIILGTLDGRLVHESMYPVACWNVFYGCVDALLQGKYEDYDKWWDASQGHLAPHPCVVKLDEEIFNKLAMAFSGLLDQPIILHVGAPHPNPNLRPDTTDGQGVAPWGKPDKKFWDSQGKFGPYGWRILAPGKFKFMSGSQSDEMLGPAIQGSVMVNDFAKIDKICDKADQTELQAGAEETDSGVKRSHEESDDGIGLKKVSRNRE